MKAKNILFAVSEALPFIKTGGLGDVGGSLPEAVNNAGGNMRVILPKYSAIPDKYKEQMTHVADFTVPLAWRNQYCGIETMTLGNVQYYFVDNEYYFYRDTPYGHGDDGERMAFFSKAVLECLKYLPDFFPEIIHCNDWHTAMIPVFLREMYMGDERYAKIKTVFTIHNLKFQGMYAEYNLGDVLGLHENQNAKDQLVHDGTLNYMRGALHYSDYLTTVSPTYAEEICMPFYGERVDEIFRERKDRLTGILNGINTKFYDPETDDCIAENYTIADWKEKKKANKLKLQEELGLTQDPDVPLISLVSRLTEQKGLDLVTFMLNELMEDDVQFAVLGVGDEKYEDAFRGIAYRKPGKAAAAIKFSEALSHMFYAGSDIMLVPSLFEPCGLTQMIAMRYAALPVVRETGGLADSVQPYNRFTGDGNGFSFANFNAHELMDTVREAVEIYKNDKAAWDKLTETAMKTDFSWDKSALEYMKIYDDLLTQE